MKNIEIKNKIKEFLKTICYDYKIVIMLWHGERDTIFSEIILYHCDKISGLHEIKDYFYIDDMLKDNEENLSLMRKNNKKVYNYLKKHFNNIKIDEQNI